MSVKSKLEWIPLATFNAASLSGSYQVVDASGFDYPLVYLEIVNDSNVSVTVSFDGTNDHRRLMAGAGYATDLRANGSQELSAMAKGGMVYVKGSAGVGTIAVGGMYEVR